MTEADRKKFGFEMTKLASAFKTQVTEPLLAAYWEDLGDASFEDFQRACQVMRRTKDFMPTIREMRLALGARKTRPVDSLWQRGLEAWTPKEKWPDQRLLGTPDFPAPRPEPEKVSEIERGARERLLRMHEEA